MRDFVRTPLCPVLEVKEMISLHYFEYVKDFQGVGESHDFWELVYVDYGEIQASAGAKTHHMSQGDMVFHQPMEMHNVFACGSFANVLIVSFECSSPAMEFFNKKVLHLNHKERDLVARLWQEGQLLFAPPYDIMDQTQLVKREDAPFGQEQVVKNLLELLLIQLIGSNTAPQTQPVADTRGRRQNEKRLVEAIAEILNQNLYRSITLDEICSQVSFSKSYVEKVFKEHTGDGIIKYFNKMKVAEAKRLISEGKYRYTEIAEMLGFGSIHYFSRTFKLHTNMTPSGYEKSVKARALL